MRPLDETWQYGEEPGGFVTLLLQHCGYPITRKHRQNHENPWSLERTRQI